jgi:hypothetical protein
MRQRRPSGRSTAASLADNYEKVNSTAAPCWGGS